VNQKILLVVLNRLSVRSVVGLFRDFLITFDPKFYRKQVRTIFALVLPRFHYLLIGQKSNFFPNRYFDPAEYIRVSPRAELKERFPFFHYLFSSSGQMPRTKWDFAYLESTSEAFDFEKSLLLHAHIYHKDKVAGNLMEDLGKKTNLNPKKNRVFEVTASVSFGEFERRTLSLEIEISNCDITSVIPSQLIERFDTIQVCINREVHCHAGAADAKKYVVDIRESNRVMILAHEPIILNIDYIIYLFVKNLSDKERRISIEKMLSHLSSRASYIPAIQTRSLPSFSMNLTDLSATVSKKLDYTNFRLKEDSKCKRILMISHEDSHTGAPIYLRQLAENLKLEGFDIHILSLRPKFRNGIFANQSLNHTYLEDYKNKSSKQSEVIRSWLLTKSGEKAIKKAFGSIEPELLLVNTLSACDAIRMAQPLGIPTILYVHESWEFELPNWPTNDPFLRRVKETFEASNLVLFGSEATKLHWEKSELAINALTMPSYRSVEIPEPTELKSIRTITRERLSISSNTKVFLSIATFEPRKRIEDILAAFNLLSNPDTHLILVGANSVSEDKEIRGLVTEPARVTFVQATKDLTEYYASADCFVFASVEETMPLVLQEAALFKLPRIVSTFSGSSEVIPSDEFAFLFPPKNVNKLAFEMNRFLESPELADQMIDRSFKLQASMLENGGRSILDAINLVGQFRTSIFPSGWSNEKD